MASGTVSIKQKLGGTNIIVERFVLGVSTTGIVVAKSGWLDLGSPRLKFLDGLLFEITNDDDFVEVYYTLEHVERYKDRESPSTTGKIKLTDGDQFIPLGVIGRFFRVTLEDFSPNVQWRWSAIEFYGEQLEDPGL